MNQDPAQQTGAETIDAQSIERARKAEGQTVEKPKTELEKLADEIVASVADDKGLPEERLVELQERIDAMNDGELDKLKENVTGGIDARLRALNERVDASSGDQSLQENKPSTGDKPSMGDKLSLDAENIGIATIDGLLTESDLEAVMFASRQKWEQAKRRAELAAKMEAMKNHFPKAVIGILTTFGIWGLLSPEKQQAIQLATDPETLNGHVRDIVRENAEKLGVASDVDIDADDLAILTMNRDQEEGEKDMIDNLIDGTPVLGTAKKAAEMLQGMEYTEVYDDAVLDMDVSKRTLINLSDKTYAELNKMLEGQDVTDPLYREMEIVRVTIESREDVLAEKLDQALLELDHPDLTEQDKLELRSEYTVENMMISDILLLMYGGEKEKFSNWLIRSMSRIPTVMRASRWFTGSKHQYMIEHASYLGQKVFRRGEETEKTGRAVRAFRELKRDIASGSVNLSKFEKFEELQKELTVLEEDVNNFTKKVGAINTENMSGFKGSLLQERDALHRRIRYLAEHKTSMLLSESAGHLLHHGKFLEACEAAAKSGGSVDVAAIKSAIGKPHIIDRYMSNAFSGVSKGVLSFDDIELLKNRYADDLGEHRYFKEALEGAFTKCNKAVGEAGDEIGRIVKVARKGTTASKLSSIQDDVSALTVGGKIKRWAPRVAIPVSVVGVELYNVASGKAEWGDVKWDVAEAAAGFVPIVGTALDFKAFATGRTLSGRELEWGWERWSTLGFGCVGVVADALTVFGGAGVGLRAGMQGLRTVRQIGRGARTATRWGSVPFRVGAKMSDALHGFTQVGNITRYKKLKAMSDGLEWNRLSKQVEAARKAGTFDETSDMAKRFVYLDRLKDAGELPSSMTSGNFLMRGIHRARVGLEKGIRGKRALKHADSADLAKFDDNIAAAQAELKMKEEAFLAVEKRGIREGEEWDQAKDAYEVAKKSLSYKRLLKYEESARRQLRRTQNVRRFRYADMATNYVFKGGLVAGGLALLTAGHTEDILDKACEMGKVPVEGAKWAWDRTMGEDWETHEEKPPIQKALFSRIEKRRTLRKLEIELADAREKGQDEMEIWKRWMDNPWAREEAMNQGVWPRLEEMLAQAQGGADSGLDAVASDAATTVTDAAT